MTRILVVHHTPSPTLQTMLDSVVEGITLAHCEAVVRPALTCSPVDALEADGYVIGGPVNLGMMAGAVKHFFDQAYYPCLDATVGSPSGSTSTATTTPPERCATSARASPVSGGAR